MIKKYRVDDLGKFNYSDIREYIDEYHTGTPLRNDEIVILLNKQDKRIKELEKEVKSKQRVIDAYEQYAKDLKEKPKHMDQRPPNIFSIGGLLGWR